VIFIFKSSAATPTEADLNKDGVVNLTDLSILLTNFNGTNATADINHSGKVDLTDLSLLLSNYGKTVSVTPPPTTPPPTTPPPTTPPPTIPPPPPAGILFGAAVEPDYLDDDKYAQTLIDYKFDSLSPENAMKFAPLEGSRGQFNFGPADKIVNFAQEHNMRMRGHTLVWHIEVPGWVDGLSNAEAASALENHIKQVVGHYKGKVKQWDVVNEALEDDGSLRDTVWKQKLGDSYIEQAFKWAREADPNAQLCYNDFGMESAGTMSDGNNLAPKSDAVLAMVKDFKARGIPIDCVGLQTHSFGDYPGRGADLLANMKRLGEAGVKVEITELDSELGADRYAEIGKACKDSGYCTGMTTWGLQDSTSYRNDNPLLFDSNLNPKPAYAALMDAIGHAKK